MSRLVPSSWRRLQAPSAARRRRSGGSGEAACRERAPDRRGRLGLAGGALSRSGRVGRIGIVDFDRVDAVEPAAAGAVRHGRRGRSEDGGRRAQAARANPDVVLAQPPRKLAAANAREIFADYDVILDGTDTFPSRYLASDMCVWLQKPLVSGSVMRFEGQVAVFDARRGPCYRCLFPEPPPPELAPNCAEAGVLGVLPGVIGLLQATEVLKLLLGAGEPLIGRLLVYDALAMAFQTFRVPKDPDCAVCGPRPTVTAPIDYATFCAAGATVQGSVPESRPRAARAPRGGRGAAVDRRARAVRGRARTHRRCATHSARRARVAARRGRALAPPRAGRPLPHG